MESVHKHIEQRIKGFKKGQLVFSSDFRGIGTDAAIKMAMSRLVKEQKLDRISQGIYYLPKKDPILGTLKPSMEEVAESIAARDRVRIRPTGSYALNRLGLSTQVPMNLVYLTDGPRRQIRMGKGVIRFKPTTPKKLSLKGPVSSLIIAALDEIGTENVTIDMKDRLASLLQKEDSSLLKHDLRLASSKVYDFLLDLLKQSHHDQMVRT
jgi:hypothetical protein